ncbi:MAG: DUF2318 domain-containing protein [Candidatus Heimdallarchaeota archaeon]|nr:MAG: DUF2318 domain-containing protein [Candidatus Heimdallarchaeota archaeon]
MSNENNQEFYEEEVEGGGGNFLKAIVLISIVGFAAIVFLQENAVLNNQQILTPEEVGDELVLSISSLSTDAQFYVYNAEDVKIYFFAVIGSDNEVHIAFDACDLCYPEKKGYSQNNIEIICNNCGNRFSINGIGTENLQGGCWPGHLPVTVANGEVHIKISDVVLKKYMFE